MTLSHLRGKIPDRMCTEVENNFKVYSRAIINIGCALNNTRDLRDFFVDTVEKIVDPCRQSRWKGAELEVFLQVYADAGSGLDIMNRWVRAWLDWCDKNVGRDSWLTVFVCSFIIFTVFTYDSLCGGVFIFKVYVSFSILAF